MCAGALWLAAASRWPVRGLLGILDRPPTLLGSWQACLFSSDGHPKATLGILDRPQTLLGSWQACLFSWPVPGLPLLFLWASESNVRHCGPPTNPSWQLAGQPATLGILDRPSAAGRPASSLRLSEACLFCSYGLPKATLGILARLQTLPSAFGLLLHRSLACVRWEPGEGGSGTCSPCTASSLLMGFRKQR